AASRLEAPHRLPPEPDRAGVPPRSASPQHGDVLEAVAADASGYLVKTASVEELVGAVRRTAAGDAVFTAGLAGLVLGEYRRMAEAPDSGPQTPQLTERETEVRSEERRVGKEWRSEEPEMSR